MKYFVGTVVGKKDINSVGKRSWDCTGRCNIEEGFFHSCRECYAFTVYNGVFLCLWKEFVEFHSRVMALWDPCPLFDSIMSLLVSFLKLWCVYTHSLSSPKNTYNLPQHLDHMMVHRHCSSVNMTGGSGLDFYCNWAISIEHACTPP